MAGAKSSESGFVPKRALSAAQPAGAPGTIVGSQPSSGTSEKPFARTSSALSAIGATPLAFKP